MIHGSEARALHAGISGSCAGYGLESMTPVMYSWNLNRHECKLVYDITKSFAAQEYGP